MMLPWLGTQRKIMSMYLFAMNRGVRKSEPVMDDLGVWNEKVRM